MVYSLKNLFTKIMKANSRSSKQQRSYVSRKKIKTFIAHFCIRKCAPSNQPMMIPITVCLIPVSFCFVGKDVLCYWEFLFGHCCIPNTLYVEHMRAVNTCLVHEDMDYLSKFFKQKNYLDTMCLMQRPTYNKYLGNVCEMSHSIAE